MKKILERVQSALYWVFPAVAAAGVKGWLILSSKIPFNADEAIVALMARHILAGKIPTFFYGQVYMGSLDAMLVSLGFRIFGEQVWVIRLVQSLLYILTVATTAVLAEKVLHTKKAGLIAGLLAAIPTVNVTLYTTVSLGGYGEALLLGNLLLLLGLRIATLEGSSQRQSGHLKQIWLLIWGGIAGLGFWAFGLTLIYALPVAGVMVYQLSKQQSWRQIFGDIFWMGLGFMIGSAPWWLFGLRYGLDELLGELTGSAISGSIPYPVLLRPFYRFYNLILLGSTVILGLRPPWEIRWLMLPILPFILIFWILVFLHTGRRMVQERLENPGLVMLLAVSLFLLAAFVFTPFGADPSGRYFVPLMIPMTVFAADFVFKAVEKKWAQSALVLLVLGFNLGGTIQSLHLYPPGLTTQFDPVARVDHRKMENLISFLKTNDITRGYTNYWVSYPLAFLSDEEVIFIPQIPYHLDFRYTERDDRYPPYRSLVNEAGKIAYITTNHEPLNQYLRNHFLSSNIRWREKIIGDYQIFYELSKTIRPADIGLGRTTDP